jgi:RNA 2',3'-cyclic 3'-phosphodiesterase
LPRLFVAIDTPAAVRPALIEVRDQLRAERSEVRWESDEKLHCTLKFLGDTREENIPRIVASLREVSRAGSPLTVTYAGLGCFPDRRDPRIIWAGIHDSGGALATLTTSIDMAMAQHGFEREKRPFHPHVTLGRVKGRRGLTELLATLETITFDCPPVVIQEIMLVHSELRPSGSVYSVLQRVALGKAENRDSGSGFTAPD